jgi:hypothetical protein
VAVTGFLAGAAFFAGAERPAACALMRALALSGALGLAGAALRDAVFFAFVLAGARFAGISASGSL